MEDLLLLLFVSQAHLDKLFVSQSHRIAIYTEYIVVVV